MERKFFKWGQFDELAKAMGIKMPKPQERNAGKLKVQREKFARCRKCGGQMTYIPSTNVFICNNVVEFEKEVIVEGIPTTKTEKKVCSNLNFVDKEYQNYMRYLFD